MLNERIAMLRKEKKVSQEELADVLNTSRQAISKWERGEAYPDIDKLKDFAIYFNVSIDYLLDYDVESVSLNSLFKRMEECIQNKSFDIKIDELKVIVNKNVNNFALIVKATNYLYHYWSKNHNEEIKDLIIEYCKKAIVVFQKDNDLGITINDIHKTIVELYVLNDCYDLVKQYIKENNVQDVDLCYAECEYALGNYDSAKRKVSEIFLNGISRIINSNVLQVRMLLKTNKIEEAYDLANWSINFIKSVDKKEQFLLEIIYALTFLKAVIERYLKKDYQESLKFLKDSYNNIQEQDYNTESIKFYYSKKEPISIVMGNMKDVLYKESEIIKDALIYDDYMYFYNELFGGKDNE